MMMPAQPLTSSVEVRVNKREEKVGDQSQTMFIEKGSRYKFNLIKVPRQCQLVLVNIG
jgi:hypothetical protein